MRISSPPPPARARNVRYPDCFEHRMENGLTVLTAANSRLPKVSATLALPIGQAHSPFDCYGLTQLTADLLREGTKRRSSEEISEEMDRWAIEYESEVTLEHTLLSVGALDRFLERALTLLTEMLLEPSFPEQELEKMKTRWRSELLSQRADPGFLAGERLSRQLFPKHPYGRVAMTPAELERADRESVQTFHATRFSPRGAYLLFAGAVDHSESIRLAERCFGDWTPPSIPMAALPEPTRHAAPGVYLVDRPNSVQTRLHVGSRCLRRSDPDLIPLSVANQIFGGGGSARLFLNLREEKGYTYGAYSQLSAFSQSGLLTAGASIRTDALSDSIRQTFFEMDRMQQEPASPDELHRSQSELIGAFVRRLETPASLGSMELVRRLYQLPENYYREFIPRIKSVTLEQVLEKAREWFLPERFSIVAVGDRSQIEPFLQELGPVRVFDGEAFSIDQEL
ncbi:MAG TPA: pitrilysin family protein [Acidobacteriota bacterium]|nr:pitrilysin family protein [Acidobacteriota bacterium]